MKKTREMLSFFTSNKQFSYYRIKFYIANHVRNHIIKSYQYITFPGQVDNLQYPYRHPALLNLDFSIFKTSIFMILNKILIFFFNWIFDMQITFLLTLQFSSFRFLIRSGNVFAFINPGSAIINILMIGQEFVSSLELSAFMFSL